MYVLLVALDRLQAFLHALLHVLRQLRHLPLSQSLLVLDFSQSIAYVQDITVLL